MERECGIFHKVLLCSTFALGSNRNITGKKYLDPIPAADLSVLKYHKDLSPWT